MPLIENLIEEGWLKTPNIIEAFKNIKREDFLPEKEKNLAEINEALPIGYGQTISQPLVVAFMLELLRPEFGEKVLDVGSGSGWTTALLSYCVSVPVGEKTPFSNSREAGKVIGIEIVPELKEFGEVNVGKYNFIKKKIARIVCADGSKGYPQEAPFDKILASAEARELPEPWKKQLKSGGIIVTPIGHSIWKFTKKSGDIFEAKEYPGFVFVPLLTEN
jgi:protein-L-isoaspartate(D-aspartate) O-methyltransferase